MKKPPMSRQNLFLVGVLVGSFATGVFIFMGLTFVLPLIK